MPHAFFYLIIIAAAITGFSIAFYIRRKKQSGGTLVCPLNSNCETVIHSDYSRFLGIPLEFLGMAYYAIIALSYLIFLARPEIAAPSAVFVILTLSTMAFLFSLYLTFLQAFTLRQWCTWCLTSATISTLIFISALAGTEFNFITLLIENRGLIAAIHLMAIAIGVGGATFTDIFFLKFLKDLRISENEAEVLHTFSQVIWLALAVIIVSGFGLWLPEAEALNESAKFIAKIAIMAVIIINGSFLNLLVAPRLVKISFGQEHEHEAGELRYSRKLGFALGAVSIISWYAAFILGIVRTTTLTLKSILLIYVLILVAAAAASQWLEQSLEKRSLI